MRWQNSTSFSPDSFRHFMEARLALNGRSVSPSSLLKGGPYVR